MQDGDFTIHKSPNKNKSRYIKWSYPKNPGMSYERDYIHRSIPILFGWDWNPKNPIRSGEDWILRAYPKHSIYGTVYSIYLLLYVHLPRKLTKCRNMYIKSKVFCFRKKRLRTCSCCSFCTLRQTSAVRCSSTWQGPEGAPGSLTAGSLRIPQKRKILFKKSHPFSGSMLIFQGVYDLIYPRC